MEKILTGVAQEVEEPRKKVIFRDNENTNIFALLTNDQIALLGFLKENELFDYDSSYEIVLDEAWKKV